MWDLDLLVAIGLENLKLGLRESGYFIKEKVKDKVEECKDGYKNYHKDYNAAYSNERERCKNMSDSQLEREIQRLKDMNGYDAKRMGKIAAMRDELESR